MKEEGGRERQKERRKKGKEGGRERKEERMRKGKEGGTTVCQVH